MLKKCTYKDDCSAMLDREKEKSLYCKDCIDLHILVSQGSKGGGTLYESFDDIKDALEWHKKLLEESKWYQFRWKKFCKKSINRLEKFLEANGEA